MTDRKTTARMKRVRQSRTSAEIEVGRFLSAIGVRYRRNVVGLPASPSIANRNRRKVVFVNGCFWHWHAHCDRGRVPRINVSFWRRKLLANRERDARKVVALRTQGLGVITVWECELADRPRLRRG